MKTRFGYVLGLTLTTAHFALPSAADAQPTTCTSRSSGDGTRIEDASFVPLGGLEQWVTIRGDDRSNPVLLHIHGGPGFAFSAFTDEFAPYEADFTVVQWDQRGAGCTFGRHGEATPEAHLRAVAAGDADLISHLDALAGLDSRSFEKFGAVNGLLQRRLPAVDVAWMQRLQSRAAEVMTPNELTTWQQGRQASIGWLIQQLAGVDLFATTSRLEVPFVVIQGSDDLNTPTDVATEYFEHVEAPAKELVIVDGAGHFAHLTHTTQFLSALREHARRATEP